MAGRDEIDRLQSIIDAIEEMLLRLPENELPMDEAQISENARIGKSIIETALKADGQRRLARRRAEMLATRVRNNNSKRSIPTSAIARRELLEKIMSLKAGALAQQLTTAFRDGRELTDSEVESILTALERLGALDDLSKQ